MIAKFTTLKNHNGFMRYLKNTSWMMAEQFLRIIAGLFVGVWVARYLGPEQFGLFSYVLAFFAIFGGIAKLGLDGIMVRELVNHPEKRDIYLGTAFWLKVIGAFIVMGLMATIVPFTSNDDTTNTFIFIITTSLVFQSFEVVEFYFQSQVLAKIVSICKVTQLAVSSVIKIYLVLSEAELILFVLVTAFDVFSLAVSYFIAYQYKKGSAFYRQFDLSISIQLFKDSWPLMFSMILIMIYMKIDQIMIKELLGEYEVGQYTAGIRLIEMLFFIPTLIVNSLFPAVLLAKKNSTQLYVMRLTRLFGFLFYLSIPVLIAVFILDKWLILFLFGAAYSEASAVLMIYAFSLPFVFVAVASSRWFVVESYQRLLFYRALLAVLINVSLNYLLIPLYGINGAAIATVVTYMFIALIFDLLNIKSWVLFKYKVNSVLFWRFL